MGIHDLGEAIDLARSKRGKESWRSVNDFFDSCVYRDDSMTAPILVVTPEDLAAVMVPSIVAVVVPSIAAAVKLALDPLSAALDNRRLGNRNQAAIGAVRSGAVSAAAQPLIPLKKETAGEGSPLPGGSGALGELPMGHPFPAGTGIPSPPFPATVAALDALTLADIDTLAVVYNDTFGIAAEDDLPVRRQKFALWISGC